MLDERGWKKLGARSRIRDFVLQNRWKNCTTCNFVDEYGVVGDMGIGTGVIPVPVFV